jgi:hypothetical protein
MSAFHCIRVKLTTESPNGSRFPSFLNRMIAIFPPREEKPLSRAVQYSVFHRRKAKNPELQKKESLGRANPFPLGSN